MPHDPHAPLAPRRRTVLLGAGTSATAAAFATTAAPDARADTVSAPRRDGLADIVLDQIGRFEPAFDPDVHTYRATCYRSCSRLTLRPITVGGAKVTVDGKAPDPDHHDRVEVALKTGKNRIRIDVGRSARYTLIVTRLATDYRGRELVQRVVATSPVGAAAGHPLRAITDGDRDTFWHPDGPVKDGEPGEEGVTSFTLDLGTERTVGRIAGHVLTPTKQWYPDEWKTYVAIDASRDGEDWQRVADHATLRQDQDILYWEFGSYHRARYFRITLLAMDSDLGDSFGVQEMQVFALPEGKRPPVRHDPPADGGQEHAFVPTEEHVTRAQELALHHGIVVGMWSTCDGYTAGSLDAREEADLSSPTAQFYDPPFHNTDFMADNPDATWGIAKAPAGGNGIQDAGTPREYLPEVMLPYAKNFIDAQYGDEGGYSSAEVEAFADWYTFSRQTYPQAITHANQYDGSSWNQLANMRHYVRTARPDLLSFDRYYWQGGGAFGSGGPAAWQATRTLLSLGIWQTQRQAALEGLSGDGSEPILFGQYLDTFDHNGSASQKAIVTSLSLASGMKWLSLFRMEINRFDGSSFFDEDGAPLRSFWEMADILARVRVLSPFLTPLNHDWLAVQPGQHAGDDGPVTGSAPVGYRMGDLTDAGDLLTGYGIAGLTATNVGTQNDGLPGDVAIGLFSPLEGIPDMVLKKSFGTTSPRAFLLVNGLISNAELPSTKKLTRYDDGQYWQTAQEIRVRVVPPAGAELKRVDPVTGTVSRVKIDRTPVGTHGRGHGHGKGREHELSFTTRIGGGQCELFFWTAPGLRVDLDPSELEMPLHGTASVTLTVTNQGVDRTGKLSIDPAAPEGWELVRGRSTSLGSLAPGASVRRTLTLRNTGALGDAWVDLNLREKSVETSAGLRVIGKAAGKIIHPTVVEADSQETVGEDGRAVNAVDGDPSTFWHTQWKDAEPPYPHEIVLDLGASHEIGTLGYLPRQDAAGGFVKEYEVFVSGDPSSFPKRPTVTGTLDSSAQQKLIGVLATGRYLKFRGLSAWDGKPFMVAAELDVQLT